MCCRPAFLSDALYLMRGPSIIGLKNEISRVGEKKQYKEVCKMFFFDN